MRLSFNCLDMPLASTKFQLLDRSMRGPLPLGQQRIGNGCYKVPTNCVRLTSAILCEGSINPHKYQLVSGAY